MAKNAGVDFDAWIAEAIAEYAEDLGVEPAQLSERERLEAIEERIDRVAREPSNAPRRPFDDDERRPSRRSEDVVRRESPLRRQDSRQPELDFDEDAEEARSRPAARRPSEDDERFEPRSARTRSRLDEAIDQLEARAERHETRAARALDSLSGMVKAGGGERERLELAIRDMEKRAERNESRTARALESLAGLVEGRSEERDRLEQAIRQIETRAERNEERTARALQSLHGLVEARGGERERLQAAIADVEARAERTAARTAEALESLTGLVETRRSERESLESAIARASKRAEESEARTARALESLTTLAQPAPARIERRDAVAARFDDLAKRAARPPEPAAAATEAAVDAARPAGEDDETFRLVAERLARRRKLRPSAAEALPPAEAAPRAASAVASAGDEIGAAVSDMRREIRRLADKVETLSIPAPVEAPRPSQDVEDARAAAEKATAERIESQLAGLADRVEKLCAASPTPADLALALKTLADARTEIARGAPAAALQAIERRLEDLAGRVESAARRAAPDPRPMEDLGRRIDAIRVALERQAGRPDAAALSAALGALNDKLDRASAAGVQSVATLSALQGAIGRLEEGLQRPTAVSLDARPIEELGRRIDGMRSIVERQGALAPKVDQLHAAVGELSQRLDRPGKAAAEIERLGHALDQIGRQVEAALARRATIDPQPIEALGERIDAVRSAVENNAALAPQVGRLEAGLAEIRALLDRPARNPQIEAVDATLRQLAAKFEQANSRPAAIAIDTKPIEDLARRIDNVRGVAERGFAPHAARLETALGEIHAKLDKPAPPSQVDEVLRQIVSKLDAAAQRPSTLSLDPKPIEDLARRIDSVRSVAERGFAPHAARLETALGEIRAKLDKAGDNAHVDAALRQLVAKVDETARRPTTVSLDPKPIEDLARRIDNVRGVAERGFAPHAARLEAALGEIRAKLDQPAESSHVDAALRQLASKVDEAVSRPTTVALDPKPIEDLARRIEGVRASLERPPSLAPQVERLESALGAVVERLDRAQPIIDAQGINSTLAEMNARLEEAFRRPANVEIDHGPIDALAARVEAVRETVERQSEQLDVVGRPIDELARRLDSLSETVERQSEQLEAGRLEEAFRSAVGGLDRPGLSADDANTLIAAIETLANKVERREPAVDFERMQDLLEGAVSRLNRPGVKPADLAEVADAIVGLSAKIDAAPAFDGGRIETLLEQMTSRLDRSGVNPDHFAAIAEAVTELGAKMDRVGGGASNAYLEDLVQDVAVRLDSMESKLDARAAPSAPADESFAHLELAVRELTEKMSDLRAASDTRSIEQEVRLLQEKLDDLADMGVSGGLAERTAEVISRDLGKRFAAADPEALIGHLQDIHQRLDILSAARSPGALESTMRELTDELEAFRGAREAVARGATTLSEMRNEQLQIDRRMDARFSGVQDVLEKLVDRLGRSDREGPAEPGPRPPAATPVRAPAPPPRAALLDIPDRVGEPRPAPAPAAAPVVDPAPLAAPSRVREVAESGAAKSAAINAHIAAARRAANAAAADSERREELDTARKAAQATVGLGARAQAMFTQHQRPILLGAAGAMTVLAGVAFLEMRGHAPVRKSEIDAPVTPSTPLAQVSPAAQDTAPPAVDAEPLGSVAGPKVIAAPLPAATPAASAKPGADLIAALPAGLGSALAAAGSLGDVGAEVEIAQRYLEGRTVPRDPKMAAGWMQAAADAGNAFAQYRLGALYEKGVGVAKDTARARDLYTKAANAGNARAMHNLAVLFAQDGGAGKPDYAAALDWFVKAANYGVRDSQFNLGVLYGRGLGASQDLASSWMWFSIAARQGDGDATRKRDEVANRMDGRAMASAKKLLDDFKAKTPDPLVNDPPPAPAAAAADAPAAKPPAKG